MAVFIKWCYKYNKHKSILKCKYQISFKFMKKKHMILPEFSQRLIWGPLRFIMIVFCSLEVKGVHNIKNIKGKKIFASNHQSELDPLLIVACLPFLSRLFPIIYVTREKCFYMGRNWKKWQKFLYGGTFFRIIGGYQTYVGLKNYGLALRNHLETLSIGNNVGIFPTGKRVKTQDDAIKAKGGVSFLAQKSNAPIIPVLIQGLENLTFKNIFSREMKVTVTFGSPLYLKDIVQNPKKMIINDKLNDYEIAATKIWEHIKKLSYKENLKSAYSVDR